MIAMNNILVVDDESIFRSGLKSLIEKTFKNINVIEAENGADALKIIEQQKIDAMLLDINMPKVDGFQLLDMIKERGIKRIPTVIISGYDDFEYARKAIRKEVSDYMLKPLTPEEAVETIQKLLDVIQSETKEDSICIIDPSKEYGNIVASIIEYISHHYQEDFSIAKMAESLGYNANYISQLFKNEVGIKLNDYIRNYRIEWAKHLLSDSITKITEIAGCVGFINSQYFSTVFKTVTGMTPQEYRENSNKNRKTQN